VECLRGLKVASLILSGLGYEKLIAIDIHVARFLRKIQNEEREKSNYHYFKGIKYWRVPSNGKIPSKPKYLLLEDIFKKVARQEFRMRAVDLRRLIWYKGAVLNHNDIFYEWKPHK
jgi:thermostable 8-oxoguanine DNA glycosylase